MTAIFGHLTRLRKKSLPFLWSVQSYLQSEMFLSNSVDVMKNLLMYTLCFYLAISELDSSYLDQHVLLLVWGVPSLMHHGSQLRSLKTTDWLLTALWLQTFWFHQVNKVIPLYISSYRILPQHLGSHAVRFHESIWNLSKFITHSYIVKD